MTSEEIISELVWLIRHRPNPADGVATWCASPGEGCTCEVCVHDRRMRAAIEAAESPHRDCIHRSALEHVAYWVREAADNTALDCPELRSEIIAMDAALAQPCTPAGPGFAWSEDGLVTHEFSAHYDVAGDLSKPLSSLMQDGDYIRVYTPKYGRKRGAGGEG